MSKKKLILFVFVISLLIIFPLIGKKKNKRSAYLPIISFEKALNRKFVKRYRKSTRYIIVHTSEAGKRSTLRTLSEGKKIRNYWTKGGHANYMIDRSGKVYRILNHIYRADHVGLSMWNGLTNLSSHSLGIELVGFHYAEISKQQYKSLTKLLKILKKTYKIRDKNVLTHSQVSYGRPNRWFKKPHRGRKKCALNFIRRKAGLKGQWNYDPDVRSRRLLADAQIKKTFYIANNRNTKRRKPVPVFSRKAKRERLIKINLSNIIGKNNTAWSIAGEDYNRATTLYVLPNGKQIRGNKIKRKIGWGKVPKGTKVHINHPIGQEKKIGPIFKITGDFTAWSFAGKSFNKTNTIYFLPNGKVKTGNRIHDWDSLPNGTKIIIGFNGPFLLNIRSAKKARQFIKKRFKNKNVVLHLKKNKLVSSKNLNRFKTLPKNTEIYIQNNN